MIIIWITPDFFDELNILNISCIVLVNYYAHIIASLCFFVLQEVIEAIADTAFKVSEYPVILSFENHCQ